MNDIDRMASYFPALNTHRNRLHPPRLHQIIELPVDHITHSPEVALLNLPKTAFILSALNVTPMDTLLPVLHRYRYPEYHRTLIRPFPVLLRENVKGFNDKSRTPLTS